ncbi:hypothetical protein HZH66_012517 [Vespula vulgaris]|uniref:Uncharacterized protein n=1 Tax=Vespula vulgaris TaxID=7454 RepID=A0A834JBR1_VESVU|nr:hypothetical protein HZH66_012517 [Vespula vulgaris]
MFVSEMRWKQFSTAPRSPSRTAAVFRLFSDRRWGPLGDGGGGGGRSSVGDGDGDGGGGGGAWTTRDARGGRREDGMKKVGLWSCAALCGGAGGE